MGPQLSASHRRPRGDTAALAGLARELDDRLQGAHPAAAVRAAVSGAMRDLRGSIGIDALPEMAFRLAHYRLTGRAAGQGL